MNAASWFFTLAIALIAARGLAEIILGLLNRRCVLAHAQEIPGVYQGRIDPTTYEKSVAYSLAKIHLNQFELTYDVLILLTVVISGFLPAYLDWFESRFGNSVWAMAGFLLSLGFLLAIPELPVDWYKQFHLEESFGFNTTSARTWFWDRFKGLLLSVALGLPLIALVLQLVTWTGRWWWLWAWAAVMAFQLVMVVLAPVLILPLFNKLTPLPAGPLRERLLALGRTTGFHARSILVMDGSRRSRHSNAFFTGFGRFRKIVLFDTLVQQLDPEELAAVLAHEIGHFRKWHIPKMLAASSLLLLAGFFCLAQLSRQFWFFQAFGFSSKELPAAFALFGLLSGAFIFWFSPIANFWSRRYEYQADAYAVESLRNPNPLIEALRKLNQENLSNLTPHPLYSAVYFTHPTLIERERALHRRFDAVGV